MAIRETSGVRDSRPRRQHHTLIRRILCNVERKLGPRTNETHIPTDHVPKLRKLVDLIASKKLSDSGYSRISVNCNPQIRLRRLHHHGTKLQNLKWATVLTNAKLTVEHRAARVQFDTASH